jgi:hypothetical protein
MRHERLIKCTVGLAMASLLTAPPTASGINIILNYDNGQSVNPAQDASATGLQALFAHAESYYQDVFEDSAANTTITINYWYEDLDSISSTTWGHHALVNETNSGGAQPWREIEANLRFDNDRTWFIDPTPGNDSEFTMAQTLWRDLTGTQQSDFYNNFTAVDIPETFEVGWRGTAVGGGAADGVADLLSTVMHEVGHSLGMSSSATGTDNEVGADADYDFNPNFIFGETLAAEVKTGSVGHIDVDFAMMCGSCAATGLRRMPSHTDLFSMAAGQNYVNLDVPRREFYGGTNWNTAGNWSGDTVPGSADEVFVRDPGAVVTANLSANGAASRLTVAEGGNVDTEGFKLDVGGLTLVTDLDTDLFIRSGGEFESSTLRIENQGEVRPDLGGLIDVNTLDINGTGSLIGAGTVDVATTLSNDGTITATGGNQLTFTTAGGAVWNLDGGNTGTPTINAITGDISFDSGTLSDAFDGDMNVGVNRFINFANGWELGTGGLLTMGGGAVIADAAEVRGAAIIRGDINVDKFAEIDGPTTFHATSSITLNDADDRLDIGNSTADSITYNGGTFSGSGTLVQDGDATVAAGTTVNIGVNNFDFAGDTISDTTILAGATMNITGTGISDAHNGIVTINSGTLNVDTKILIDPGGPFPIILPQPWEMAGSLVFLDNGTNPVLTGSKVNITGAVSVPITGTGVIDAAVEFHPTSNTEITSASDKLQLDGTTTFNGGTYNGFGEIEQNGTATVSTNTTIGVGRYDMDGSVGDTTINLNADLIINSTYIEDGTGNVFNGTININDDQYELTVNTASPWTMAGTLNITTDTALTLPAIDGQDFTLSGTANIEESTRFDAKVNLTGDIVFTTATSRLAILGGDLVDPNTINGGTVTGPAGSSLRTTLGHALVGHGTIGVRLDFLPGSELLADNGTLSVPGNFISMGVIGTHDADGILDVTSAWNTSSATELQLNGGSVTGSTITNGGLTTGFGTIATTGAFINDNVTTATGGLLTLNPAGNLDLDGSTETGTLNLANDMTVDAPQLDIVDNVFDGTINVTNGFAQLTINTVSPWTMDGTLNITHGVLSTNTSIAGQDFTMSGTTNISAWTGFAARTDITGAIVLQINNSVLSLSGGDTGTPNTIDGGSITGLGRLSFGTFDALVGNGSVTPSEISMSLGARLLASGGTMFVNSSSFNPAAFARIGTADGSGILSINGPFATSLIQALELNGGSVIGTSINNDGLTTGFGTIAPTGGFQNNNIVTGNGGTLVLNPTGALDLDGAGNTGTINALTGSVRVAKNIGVDTFAGTLNVGIGQSFTMDFGGLSNIGQINLTGGMINGPVLNHFNTLDVSGNASAINAAASFENGSTTTLGEDLTLLGDTLIRPLAGINGTASLIVSPGTTLNTLDGVQIHAILVNDGAVVPGSSPGTLVADNYTQTPGGEIQFELAGLTQGSAYDWLKVGDNATLDGLLEVVLFGGFTPGIGDSFDIITAGTGLSGVFGSILFPAIPNIGLGISYATNAATLNAGLIGDLDNDGFVGITDLNIVLGAWNNNVTAGVWIMGDPTGDGFIGIEDLNVVLGNWNAGTPPLTQALSRIPEPGLGSLIAAGTLSLATRRRNRV